MLLAHHRVNQSRFSEVMGVDKLTVSRWLSGGKQAPAAGDLQEALQVACNYSNVRPSTGLPWLWINREDLWNFPFQTESLSMQKALATLDDILVPAPILTLDRITVCFHVESELRRRFLESLGVHERIYTDHSPYRRSWRTRNGLFISASPRFPGQRVDPDTGEVFDGRPFARVDVPSRMLQFPDGLRAMLAYLVGPFVAPNTLELTLIDFACDYRVDSWLMLHFEEFGARRSLKRYHSGQPEHDWLAGLSSNQYFGSKSSTRYIRAYDKNVERADKLLIARSSGPLLQAKIQADWSRTFQDDEYGEVEPDGLSVVQELRLDEQTREFWPAHLRRVSQAHWVEASVRPRSIGSGGFDRRPAGLVDRLIEHNDPFNTHRIVHLGFLQPDSMWLPVLLRARLHGVAAPLQALRRIRGRANQGCVLRAYRDELTRLAEITASRLIVTPDQALRASAVQLQSQLDRIFAGVVP